MNGKLVGIAHLVDAFGDRDVETVTAVTDNNEIDEALAARARAVIQRDDPDLLVLQLLSVDQTGHARGSYNKEGQPLPAAEIWLLYEAGSHTRMGASSRTLRGLATGSTPSTYFPDSAEFYGSSSFLDAPIQNAVRARGEAENYTDAQRRQAINKSVLRILYHWAKFYMNCRQRANKFPLDRRSLGNLRRRGGRRGLSQLTGRHSPGARGQLWSARRH